MTNAKHGSEHSGGTATAIGFVVVGAAVAIGIVAAGDRSAIGVVAAGPTAAIGIVAGEPGAAAIAGVAHCSASVGVAGGISADGLGGHECVRQGAVGGWGRAGEAGGECDEEEAAEVRGIRAAGGEPDVATGGDL
ncbi:MAG: hypothetical protein ABJC26_17425 [Gemmatimonadaceae bacterium]